jgi:hypothetical protein
VRVIGQGAAGEMGRSGQGVGDAFDQAERRGGRAQGGGEQAGQQRGGYLVACVGEQARGADPGDTARQP